MDIISYFPIALLHDHNPRYSVGAGWRWSQNKIQRRLQCQFHHCMRRAHCMWNSSEICVCVHYWLLVKNNGIFRRETIALFINFCLVKKKKKSEQNTIHRFFAHSFYNVVPTMYNILLKYQFENIDTKILKTRSSFIHFSNITFMLFSL